jgi:hypothetical protein
LLVKIVTVCFLKNKWVMVPQCGCSIVSSKIVAVLYLK